MSDESEDIEGRVPTWREKKAVYSHVTHAALGSQFDEGDEMVVMFRNCAVVCTVDEIVDEKEGDDGG